MVKVRLIESAESEIEISRRIDLNTGRQKRPGKKNKKNTQGNRETEIYTGTDKVRHLSQR